jgi:hypothetical protein
MEFRRFNEMGVKAFAAHLDTLRSIPAAPVPIQLLTDPSLTQALDQPISAEPRTFTTRMEFALWLDEATRHSNSDVPHRDIGFWAWLTLFLFENVCPGDSQGRHKLKEDARYLPMLDSPRRYYRHSLVGPYAIFKLYEHKPEQADALLCGSLAKLTDEAYRLFVENQLVFYPAAVSILSSFYFDANRKILSSTFAVFERQFL